MSSSSSSALIPPVIPSNFTVFGGDTAYIVEMPLTPGFFQGREWEPIKALYMREIQFAEEMPPIYELMGKIEKLEALLLIKTLFSEKQTKELVNFLTCTKQIKSLRFQECTLSEISIKILFASLKSTGITSLTLDNPISEEILEGNTQDLSNLENLMLPESSYSPRLVESLLLSVPHVSIKTIESKNSNKRLSELSKLEELEDRKLMCAEVDDEETLLNLSKASVKIYHQLIEKLESKECIQALFLFNQPSARLNDKLAKVYEKEGDEREFLYFALLETQFLFYDEESVVDLFATTLNLSEDETLILESFISDYKEYDFEQLLVVIEQFFRENGRNIQIHYYDICYQLTNQKSRIETECIIGEGGERLEFCTNDDKIFRMELKPAASSPL